ncbi:HAUS augmin-like complex subunit 4-domain-containing protein [Powellomyces hirtus]|nr:HAUS augmin-like complex subunit 4-domain-containing protein [Powellomyces hirtus]
MPRASLLAELCARGLPSAHPRSENLPDRLAHARNRYLQLQILHHHVSDIVLGLEDEDCPGWSESEVLLFQEPLNRLLRSAETQDLLQSSPPDSTPTSTPKNILGLDAQKWNDLEHAAAVNQVPDELRALLVAETERRMQSTCATLARSVYRTPAPQTTAGAALAAAKAHGLRAHFITLQESTRNHRQAAARTRIELAARMTAYIEKWTTLMIDLHTLIAHHKCAAAPRRHAAFMNYFAAIVENAHLKLRCLAAEIQLTFSDSKDTDVLKAARSSLDATKHTIDMRLCAADTQLAQYAHVGDEFSRIVAAYSDIVRNIALVEDDIARMTAPVN